MSTIKNDQISLYCNFNKIVNGRGISSSLQHWAKNMLEMFVLSLLVFDQISFW